jgi:hypothetical protein
MITYPGARGATSASPSLVSFCRHGRPLRRRGYCSFMASMPTTLMTWGNAPGKSAVSGVRRPVAGMAPFEPGRMWVVGRIMRKLLAGAVSAVAVVAAVTACGTTTTVVHAPAPKPSVAKATTKPAPAVIKTVKPKPTVTKTITEAPSPAASTPAAAPAPGYLGDIFGGGTGNPCNFASGYQIGDCNPAGETEQQYIDDPGGPAPGTSTNAQGCYYVKMGEGYCPSTGTYIPMQDPTG